MSPAIQDPQLREMIEHLSDLTGETPEDALRHAIQERLRRLEQRADLEQAAMRLVEIGRQCVQAIGGEAPHTDSDLYDEFGLPR